MTAECERPPDSARPKLLECTTISLTVTSFLLPLLETAKGCGYAVHVACGFARPALPAVPIPATRVFRVPFSRRAGSPANLRAFFAMRRLLCRERYSLVHVHTPVASFVTRLAAGTLGRRRPKVIYTAHGLHFQAGSRGLFNRFFLLLEVIASRWTDVIVVMNDEDEEAAWQYRLGRRVVRIDGIGVDPDKFSPERFDEAAKRHWRRENGIPDSARVLTMVAEMNPGKRHSDLIRAMPLILSHRSDVLLLLVGCGRLKARLEAVVGSLGLHGKVRFLGWRDDMPQLLACTTIVVLPSLREGLPRSVLESMSMAVAVIGTKTRGIKDLLALGAGVLIPVRNPSALAEAVVSLLDNSSELARLGRRGRELVLNRFSQTRICDQYRHLMSETAKPSPMRPEEHGERQ